MVRIEAGKLEQSLCLSGKTNLEKDLFPYFAARRIGDIEPIELLAAVRQVEERGALDVAHRALTTALQLAPMLFQRPGELRAAAWAEFDLDAALWTIHAARMKRRVEGKKNGDPHLVPLSTQAVAILRKLQPLRGNGTLLFPGERSHDRPISDNTLRAAM